MNEVEQGGATWHHVDVMDGHFVPNLTIGPPIIKAMKQQSRIPLDVHIMVSNPDQVADDYIGAGADILTFHIEAALHAHRLIQHIQSKGVKAGVSLNPGTPIESVLAVASYVDLILVMSVNPGFGGQSFIPESTTRIKQLDQALRLEKRRDKVIIEVDGGVTIANAGKIVQSGADALVAGTAVYGAKDRKAAIQALKIAS
jgi:ribulose-phosphate 3-epimerase